MKYLGSNRLLNENSKTVLDAVKVGEKEIAKVEPYKAMLLSKAGELVRRIGED